MKFLSFAAYLQFNVAFWIETFITKFTRQLTNQCQCLKQKLAIGLKQPVTKCSHMEQCSGSKF